MTDYLKALLISDFTVAALGGYLDNDSAFPRTRSRLSPYGQVMQLLEDERHECWSTAPDFSIVWTRPETISDEFNKALQYGPVSISKLLEEVDCYCAALRRIHHLKWIFVPTWLSPGNRRGFGAFDLRSDGGITSLLMRMNLRLIDNLSKLPNYVVLDAQKWAVKVGPKTFSTKRWYLGKIPFSNELFKEAARDIKTGIKAMLGQTKKVVILDLDGTLWDGIVGDVGWEHLILGGHDPVGEALVDFQKQLKALRNRGVLLAIVSKNEESIALEAIKKHPEMVIREADLAAWRINWNDKAANVIDIASELNVGVDSLVFLDDNPAERARVREALPGVLVPEWPEDKLLYPQALSELDCFDTPTLSDEDRSRANMYAAEVQRSSAREESACLEDWLTTLNICLTVESLQEDNLTRVTQLINKTNQMNLATRRLSISELNEWTAKSNHSVFAFRVSDRFGDSGLVGIISTEIQDGVLEIVDFILSCRVMGRNIEKSMLSVVFTYAQERGISKVFARYRPTEKNKPCLDFFLGSSLTHYPDGTFWWDFCDQYPAPPYIKVQDKFALVPPYTKAI
jgi:FkbH-like protein